MALQMWNRDDIRNLLAGIEIASSVTNPPRADTEALAFRAGFRAALHAAAASFGLYPAEVGPGSAARDPSARVDRGSLRALTD